MVLLYACSKSDPVMAGTKKLLYFLLLRALLKNDSCDCILVEIVMPCLLCPLFPVVIKPKEVSVYPKDAGKPPVGEGLNKRAVIRLDGYWPICKTTRQPIRDAKRLTQVNYVATLKKSTAKIDATYVDYLPETGSCIFRVSYVDSSWY